MVPVGDGNGLPAKDSRSIGILIRNGGKTIRCLPYEANPELAMDVDIFEDPGIWARIPVEFETESGDVLILLQYSLFAVT